MRRYKDDIAKDIAESRLIEGKGWTILKQKDKKRFQAYAQNGTDWKNKVFLGSRSNFKETVELAMGESFKRRWLDWNKSVRWCKLRNVEISNKSMLSVTKTKRQKGWYVSSGSMKLKDKRKPYFFILVGKSWRDGVYVLSSNSKFFAIKQALPIIKKSEYFDYESSKLWLEENKLHELIKLL